MRKKVGIIGVKGLPAFGGTASVGENIVEQLKDRYDFTVYAISSHTDHKGDLNGFKQFVIRKFPIKKLNILYYYLIAAMHATFFSRYDFIHLHQIDAAFILYILRIRYRVISTSHGRTQTVDKWGKMEKKFFAINEKLFLKRSSIITSVSSDLANIYRSQSDRNIHYIPNGINIDTKVADLSGIKHENYILFAAGRIIAKKGCHILLEALNNINYTGKVLIVGDINQIPDYREKLFKLSESLEVEFIDLIKDKELLMAYIRKAKLFVFPSSQEAMSMMLLEVASMKTPIVSSDIPENKAVFDEDSVLFFKTDDEVDLSEKLKYALEQPKIMDELSNNAYKVLMEKYQWRLLADKYAMLYEDLLK